MVDLDTIPETQDEATRVLAAAHALGLEDVRFFVPPDADPRVVRLIEVSDAFPEAGVMRPDARGVDERVVPVFPMREAIDFPFRSEIAQVTTAEWDDLRNGRLRLNRPWGDLRAWREVRVGD